MIEEPIRANDSESTPNAFNAAAIREALASVRNWCQSKLCDISHPVTVEGLLSIVEAALSAPARNCDVGKAWEQIARHRRWCEAQKFECAITCRDCFCKWAQMPYEAEEGGTK
jgi:hypothetical protein